jgi:hypothetical protein
MPAGGLLGAGLLGAGGALEQPATTAKTKAAIMPTPRRAGRAADLMRDLFMLVLMLEAFAVLLLFVFMIWWTMFSGRKNGELQDDAPDSKDQQP